MYNSQDIAKRIKTTAKSNNISLKNMLAECDMGINAISQMAKGNDMLSKNLAKIADYLNCSVDYLLGRTNVPDVIIRDENGNFVAIIEAMAPNKSSAPSAFTKEAEYRIAAHGGHVNEETQPSEPEYTSNLRKR